MIRYVTIARQNRKTALESLAHRRRNGQVVRVEFGQSRTASPLPVLDFGARRRARAALQPIGGAALAVPTAAPLRLVGGVEVARAA